MIAARVNWTGDTRFVHKMTLRGKRGQIERVVVNPWKSWVLKSAIPTMYRRGGRVPGDGGQGGWAPLRPATVEKKGSSTVFKGSGRFGSMRRSYRLDVKRIGLRAWDFLLTNRARSKGWTTASGKRVGVGFDYPSALHTGWGGYTVSPRWDNPHQSLRWRLASGSWVRIPRGMSTHPQGAEERPHIRIHGPWIRRFEEKMIRWVLLGRRS